MDSLNLVIGELAPRRVAAVRSTIVSLELSQPIRTAIHNANSIEHVLVRVYADDGLTGIGHMFAFGQRRARVLQCMVDDLGERLCGRNALALQENWRYLWSDITFLGHSGIALMALSTLDCACWDILGKATNTPVWALLGGTQRAISCYASDGLWLGDALDTLADQARSRVALGYAALKVRVGSQDIAEDEERVTITRQAVGSSVAIMADVNQGWSQTTAIEAGQRLLPYKLYWLEEPVDADDLDGLLAVKRSVDIPIAAGESWYGLVGVQPALRAGAVHTLMLDLQRIGGITEWMRVAQLAHTMGIQISSHLFPEIHIHIMCTQEGDYLMEYVPWFYELFEEAPTPEGGMLRPWDRPGLGLDFRPSLFPM